jgi:hypothetical protein
MEKGKYKNIFSELIKYKKNYIFFCLVILVSTIQCSFDQLELELGLV